MNNSVQRRPSLLLVEDNPADVELVREALSNWDCPPELTVIEDGQAALEYLSQKAGPAWPPDLILLDLNLPKKDGFAVLQSRCSDRELTTIPVVVLTTSDRERDVRDSYRLHANVYITKSLDFSEFMDKIKAIEQFWMRYARLPNLRLRSE